MELLETANRALEQIQSPGDNAEIRHVRIPDRVVVGRRKGDKDRRQKTAIALPVAETPDDLIQVGCERAGVFFDDRPRCDCISREMNSR